MTPCEEKGYKVGEVFEIVDERAGINGLNGDIIILISDDGTDWPFFHYVKTSGSGKSGEQLCKSLDSIKRIYPPEEKSQDVEVVCEGKTVVISRKSAEALNLC